MAGMENQQLNLEDHVLAPAARKPALPLLALLALASALGVVVAIALAGLTMLLAAPAYAEEGGSADGSLLLQRHGAMVEAQRVSSEVEVLEEAETPLIRVVEVYHNPFNETLNGVYLYRLPPNVVLERLSFAPEAAEARHAVISRREVSAVVESAEAVGPGETLVVVLQYRPRSVRRILALAGQFPN